MIGTIFIALSEMIENRFGIDAWEDILREVKPESEGVYTSTESYPDSEIQDYILAIARKQSIAPSEFTRQLGRCLFDEFNKKHSIFTTLAPDLFQFLNGIDGIIHKEAGKLYDQSHVPMIGCKIVSKNDLRLTYSSPRKLCFLAEGLVFGAADFYGEKIDIVHEQCMHKGDPSCEIRVLNYGR